MGVDSGRKGEMEGGSILRRHLSKAKELGIHRILAMEKIWEHISNEIESKSRVFGKGKWSAGIWKSVLELPKEEAKKWSESN